MAPATGTQPVVRTRPVSTNGSPATPCSRRSARSGELGVKSDAVREIFVAHGSQAVVLQYLRQFPNQRIIGVGIADKDAKILWYRGHGVDVCGTGVTVVR